MENIFSSKENYIHQRLSLIKKELEKAETISIFVHINPDGDCIGAGVALCRALNKMGKKAFVYSDDAVPEKYLFLPYVTEYMKLTKDHVDKVDVAICVDVPALDRIGNAIPQFLSARKQLAIDHHVSRAKFADVSAIDADAAAAGELVFELIKMLKQMDDEIAELLFASIISDTGCFQFSNTTDRTLRMAGELRKYKIDAQDIIYKAYSSISKEVFDLKQRVLNKCKFYENNKIGIITFTKEDFEKTNTTPAHTEGIISSIRNINCVKIAISIAEVAKNSYKVSIRTNDGYDATYIAGVFGGGGHKAAAGCRINGIYEDIIERLLKASTDLLG